MNREAWLTELSTQCVPFFKGFRVHPFRITCGWPCQNAVSGKNRRIGECHGAKSSGDGRFEIFVSPILDKPIEVAGVVCHELAHVAAGIEAAHGKGFVRVCRHVGLTRGKPRSVSPGPALTDKLTRIVESLGAYPHSALRPVPKITTREPSVSSLECECGCKITMGKKSIDEYGLPTCACGSRFAI